jgi:hypothetical protein
VEIGAGDVDGRHFGVGKDKPLRVVVAAIS